MEDNDLIILDLAENISLFGVFDGHGGQEVSKFV
jgi:serine/threonine protein phosphatase PrpC